MRDSGTWVIPTFNFQLRTAKPVMLYWLQRASYEVFGISEWSARLPSAVAGLLAMLLTYELGRRMFGRATGLLAGVVLASAVQFGILAHAATPDATLLVFTTLAFLAFWAGHAGGSRRWWVPTAVGCGLAVLTKGPIGLALPGIVIVAYFAWTRELGRLLDRRLILAALVFVLVAGPWYALVASETRGEWVKVFLARENVTRFLKPLDGHRGPAVFYLLALVPMFAPWSAFLVPAAWYGVKGTKQSPGAVAPGLSDTTRAHRFLVVWAVVYFTFFSTAATKLPNYIFPVYPALAILTARFLAAWREGVLVVPRWVLATAVGGVALVGLGFAGLALVAGRLFAELTPWAILGLVPLAGAAGMAWALRRGDRGGVVRAAAVAAVAFVALLAALPPAVMDRYKAPKELVRATGVSDPSRDVRLAAYGWLGPSLVFYSGREVKELESPEAIAAFLEVPTPAYLFIPERTWTEWGQVIHYFVKVPWRVAARHYDIAAKCEVLVITNDMSGEVAGRGVATAPGW
jgi:4-amino-4-deoxy-L-arabinose transferase-like glycosyltransferase